MGAGHLLQQGFQLLYAGHDLRRILEVVKIKRLTPVALPSSSRRYSVSASEVHCLRGRHGTGLDPQQASACDATSSFDTRVRFLDPGL